jgi:AcrR family transcriptional regulator
LEAATQRFSTYGLSGARVDAIATAADTNERMLYYYFESKEGLHVALFGITSAGTVDALDFYVTLAAMGYYLVSNRFCRKAFVGRDYTEASGIEAVTEMQFKMLIAYLHPASPPASPNAFTSPIFAA